VCECVCECVTVRTCGCGRVFDAFFPVAPVCWCAPPDNTQQSCTCWAAVRVRGVGRLMWVWVYK